MKKHTKDIQAVVFDFDGVFTDNRELVGLHDGSIGKFRSHYDGQGVSFLRDIGIQVAIATNESEKNALAVNFLVNKWNNLPSTKIPVKDGRWHPVKLFTGVGHTAKAAAVKEWLKEIGVSLERCAAMGDDVVDYPLLKIVGFRAVPSTGEKVVKGLADFVSERGGGYGAVRDFVNFFLTERKIDQSKLRPF